MTVRTRIAPSPTGDPHVGTAYVALFNMAFAHSQGGQFLLRIEDTDQARSTPESEKAILDALHWLGLDWDEGPDNGGSKGPYRQSERSDIYREHANKLLDSGHAFRCFCTAERLDELRVTQMENKQQLGYDGHCMHLSEEEVAARVAKGESHVVRMQVPREGQCTFNDMLRGEISIDWAQIDLQILLKADGMPTYHLANVVDDHLMEISHVIRGEEWINSAPKHILLYQYFGWDAPVFCHLPLLRNVDKSKLSKRKNPTSILYYQRMGYLPEALLNYLGRMGWSMPTWTEITALSVSIITTTTLEVLAAYQTIASGSNYTLFGNAPVLFGISLQIHHKLLIIVPLSIISWLIMTFITDPEPDEKLEEFYRRIQPGGWWGPITKNFQHTMQPVADGFLIQWISGTLMIYGFTFGIGNLIFINYSSSILCFGCAAIGSYLVWNRGISKLG